jgi:hypothetical protein
MSDYVRIATPWESEDFYLSPADQIVRGALMLWQEGADKRHIRGPKVQEWYRCGFNAAIEAMLDCVLRRRIYPDGDYFEFPEQSPGEWLGDMDPKIEITITALPDPDADAPESADSEMTVPEAAVVLKRKYQATLDLMFRGELRARKLGRRWYVNAADVQRLALVVSQSDLAAGRDE